MSLSHFHGGLKLESHKAMSTREPITPAELPEKVVLPVRQHIGAAALVNVEIGEQVKKGQQIALGDGYVSAPVHASISGRVSAIEDRDIAHPSGLKALCIEIESDGKDEWLSKLPTPVEDYHQLDAVELRNVIRDAGIVGLGGAAFPTAVKLNPPHHTTIHTLVLNAAECEPYISCDDLLMREKAAEILQGIAILQHLLKPEITLIGIEDNKPEAIAAMKAALEISGIAKTRVEPVPTIYPTGGERQLIKVLTDKEVPSHGLPADIGIVCQNIGTAYSIYQAVIEGLPLIERVITVTGQGVKAPRNFRARIGTLMSDLTRQAGGYNANADRLIMGGPLMGISLQSDQLPIIKSTNCLLVAAKAEVIDHDNAMPCIRCGQCAEACPAQLVPQQLYWFASSRNFDKIQDYNLFDCIECGCCSYVCPSKIPLVQYYRFAKTEIWSEERQSHKSNIARERHEFRTERLEQQKREKEERMAKKRAALKKKSSDSGDDDPKKAAIKAAMERARARKAEREGEATEKPERKKVELTPEQQAKIDAAKARRKKADTSD